MLSLAIGPYCQVVENNQLPVIFVWALRWDPWDPFVHDVIMALEALLADIRCPVGALSTPLYGDFI